MTTIDSEMDDADETPSNEDDGATNNVLWQGRQWRVVPGFLEAKAGQDEYSTYDLAWNELGPRLGGVMASLHASLSEKVWVDYDDFCTAYRVAVTFAGTPDHDIDALEEYGRSLRKRLTS